MSDPEKYFLNIHEIQQSDVHVCGPKAAGLAWMIRNEIPVPLGFCITTHAYRKHLSENGLDTILQNVLRDIKGLAQEQRQKRLDDFRNAIISAPVPASIADGCRSRFHALDAESLAVRSSASAEDLPSASFAGQHDTILGVTDPNALLAAVKKCWASLWSDRAFEYRERNGIDHQNVEMAVIVQKLIPASASGVIFTIDPVSGDRNRMVIESTIGLGEPLVSGKVTPDRIVLSRPDLKILTCSISGKSVQYTAGSDGAVRETSVAPECASTASIDEKTVARVGELAIRAEKLFGTTLDIEFAISDEQVYLLQARPITAISAPVDPLEDSQVWSNINTGEVAPDVMTPATWSIVRPLVVILLGTTFKNLGIDLTKVRLIGQSAGRAYFNLNTLLAIAHSIPLMSEEKLLKSFGGIPENATSLEAIKIAKTTLPDLGTSHLRIMLGLLKEFSKIFFPKPSILADELEKLKIQIADEISVDPGQLSDDDLIARITYIFNSLGSHSPAFAMATNAQFYVSTLYESCRKWYGEEGGGYASRILTGLGNVESAVAGQDMWRLARIASKHDGVKSILMESGSFESVSDKLCTVNGGSEFIEAFDTFMKTHGHHCRAELELINPRWSETPNYILDQIRSFIGAPEEFDFGRRYENLQRESIETIKTLRQRLKNPLKRRQFDFLVKHARLSAPSRETLRSQMVRKLAYLRMLLLDLGQRLLIRGLFECRDDIFFLEIGEIPNIASGVADPGAVRRKIASRRAEYEFNKTITPPPIIIGRFDPSMAIHETPGGTSRTLTGLAVNPGMVTGPARVVLRSGDDTVLAGEILVAPFTDPGWTPYFINAAAIVMDQGGLLSHGCIIAREYGIPAVVNVGQATRIIKTGQMIQVDGGRGIVRIL